MGEVGGVVPDHLLEGGDLLFVRLDPLHCFDQFHKNFLLPTWEAKEVPLNRDKLNSPLGFLVAPFLSRT